MILVESGSGGTEESCFCICREGRGVLQKLLPSQRQKGKPLMTEFPGPAWEVTGGAGEISLFLSPAPWLCRLAPNLSPLLIICFSSQETAGPPHEIN